MTVFFVVLLAIFVLVALSVVMMFAGSLIQGIAIQAKVYLINLKGQLTERKRQRAEYNRVMQQYGK